MTSEILEDFIEHSNVDFNDETVAIAHHGILGMKWGRENGPPYPIGSGDHSAGEKRAAKEAGVKVGSDSGKGSIENLDKKGSSGSSSANAAKPETPEEHKAKVQNAVKSGNRDEVKKYASEMTLNELNEAVNRIGAMERLQSNSQNNQQKGDSDEEKARKERVQAAIKSGDKTEIAKHIGEMNTNEINDAVNRLAALDKFNNPQGQNQNGQQPVSAAEKARQAALNSGDRKQILAVAKQSSKQELETAMQKADKMDQLIAEVNPPPKTISDKINGVMDKVDTLTKWYDTSAGAWNRAASIVNTFNTKGDDLPYLPEKGQAAKKTLTAAQKAATAKQEEAFSTVMKAAHKGDYKRVNEFKGLLTTNQLKQVNAYMKEADTTQQTYDKYANRSKREQAKAEKERKKQEKQQKNQNG